MMVTIDNLLSTTGALHVSFHSPAGSGIAEWIGSPPSVGQQYDVELDMNEIFCWGKNIHPSTKKTEHFYSVDDNMHLVAELISIAEDNCAAIRINGSITLTELDSAPDPKPSHIDLVTTALYLNPTNIQTDPTTKNDRDRFIRTLEYTFKSMIISTASFTHLTHTSMMTFRPAQFLKVLLDCFLRYNSEIAKRDPD